MVDQAHRNLSDHFKLEGVLGKGSFATVQKATNKKTGEKVAIKIIDKSQLTEEDRVAL